MVVFGVWDFSSIYLQAQGGPAQPLRALSGPAASPGALGSSPWLLRQHQQPSKHRSLFSRTRCFEGGGNQSRCLRGAWAAATEGWALPGHMLWSCGGGVRTTVHHGDPRVPRQDSREGPPVFVNGWGWMRRDSLAFRNMPSQCSRTPAGVESAQSLAACGGLAPQLPLGIRAPHYHVTSLKQARKVQRSRPLREP